MDFIQSFLIREERPKTPVHGGTLRLKHNDEGRVTFAVVVE